METPKQAVDVIMPRIQKNFKRLNRHQYWLSIVNNPYDEKYSFFIYDKVPRDRTRSTPLHDLKSYDIEYLEEVVKLLTQQTKLSIVYTGFTGLRWHSMIDLSSTARFKAKM